MPAHGLPRSPELYRRRALHPRHAARIRTNWWWWNVWGTLKAPLCVRVTVDERTGGREEVTRRLKEIGVDWEAFADGSREAILDRLERLAGKGSSSSPPPPRRLTPVSDLDLSIAPTPLPRAPPAHPASAPNKPYPPIAERESTRRIYRDILSALPIITIDLQRLEAREPSYVDVAFSPWGKNGPALFAPIDPVRDGPFLLAAEDGQARTEGPDAAQNTSRPHTSEELLAERAGVEQRNRERAERRKVRRAEEARR